MSTISSSAVSGSITTVKVALVVIEDVLIPLSNVVAETTGIITAPDVTAEVNVVC